MSRQPTVTTHSWPLFLSWVRRLDWRRWAMVTRSISHSYSLPTRAWTSLPDLPELSLIFGFPSTSWYCSVVESSSMWQIYRRFLAEFSKYCFVQCFTCLIFQLLNSEATGFDINFNQTLLAMFLPAFLLNSIRF